MAQLLVVAHAPLASALLTVAQHAYPECSNRLAAVDVDPHAELAHTQAAIQQAMHSLVQRTPSQAAHPFADAPEVLVLTDVFGATPFNAALGACSGASVRIVAGVNVPMLWRVLCYVDQPLEELVQRALAGASQGAVCAEHPRPNIPPPAL